MQETIIPPFTILYISLYNQHVWSTSTCVCAPHTVYLQHDIPQPRSGSYRPFVIDTTGRKVRCTMNGNVLRQILNQSGQRTTTEYQLCPCLRQPMHPTPEPFHIRIQLEEHQHLMMMTIWKRHFPVPLTWLVDIGCQNVKCFKVDSG